MNGNKLEQRLYYHFQMEVQKVAPSGEWWDNALSRVSEQQRRPSLAGFIIKIRPAWALVLIMLVLVAGTVYGASSLIKELFQKFAAGVETAGLAQELDLSQTIDGVTIRLERAYADSNVVLLGLTVSGAEQSYHTNIGTLTTDSGQTIPAMMGLGIVPGSDMILGTWQPDERIATITAFDASGIKTAPTEINLTLKTSVSDPPSFIFGESQRSIGPFIFNFNVPYHTGKVVDIGRTVEAAGVTMTMDSVVISPWATRAVFSFSPPYDDREKKPIPIASIQPAGGYTVNSALGATQDASSVQYFIGDFTERAGEWTVTVKELVFPPESPSAGTHPASETKRLTGPWVFRFQVP